MLANAIDPSVVRLADPSDEDELVHMVRELHKESGIRDGHNEPFPFSESKVRATIREAVPFTGDAIIGIIGAPGRLEGSVYVVRNEPWYSRKQFIQERWNFVLPEFRKSNNAKILIAFSKAVASAWQQTLLMGCMSTERQAAKLRLYQRHLGCEPFGAFFVFNFDQQSEA